MQTARISRLLLGLLLVASLVPGPVSAAPEVRAVGRDVAPHVAADPTAPVVTAASLAEVDRFWPFHVTLEEPWTPPGRASPIGPRPGVLVRVNPDGTARIDFASEGRFDVPIERTDLVEAANRLRRGEQTKLAPNLVLTIGNKLIDPRESKVRVFEIPRDTRIDALLCVFADPDEEAFAELARALAPTLDRDDVQIVVFPQTQRRDLGVGRRLRELGFRVPFVRDRYKVPFTRSLLSDEPVPLPHVQLATKDGRLLLDEPWRPGLVDRLESALERLHAGTMAPPPTKPRR